MTTAAYKNVDPVTQTGETGNEPDKVCLINLDFLFDSIGENFHDKLFSMRQEKGLSDVEVYNLPLPILPLLFLLYLTCGQQKRADCSTLKNFYSSAIFFIFSMRLSEK